MRREATPHPFFYSLGISGMFSSKTSLAFLASSRAPWTDMTNFLQSTGVSIRLGKTGCFRSSDATASSIRFRRTWSVVLSSIATSLICSSTSCHHSSPILCLVTSLPRLGQPAPNRGMLRQQLPISRKTYHAVSWQVCFRFVPQWHLQG